MTTRLTPIKSHSPSSPEALDRLQSFISRIAPTHAAEKLIVILRKNHTVQFSTAQKLAYIALNDAVGVHDLKDLFRTSRGDVIDALRASGIVCIKDYNLLESAARNEWRDLYNARTAHEAIAEAYADRYRWTAQTKQFDALERMATFFFYVSHFFLGHEDVVFPDKDFRKILYEDFNASLQMIGSAASYSERIAAQASYSDAIHAIEDYNRTALIPITAHQIRQTVNSRINAEKNAATG